MLEWILQNIDIVVFGVIGLLVAVLVALILIYVFKVLRPTKKAKRMGKEQAILDFEERFLSSGLAEAEKINKYDVVVFDWNGTIIDDVEACHEILCKMLVKYGFEAVSMEEYKKAFTFPVVEYYKKVGFKFDKYSFEEIAKDYIPMYNEAYPKCELYEGAEQLLGKLNDYGIKLYLLSATQKSSLKEQTDYFGVTGYFTDVLGTDNYHGKNKTQEAKALAKNKNLKNKKILFVGDTVHDFEVSKILGADCVLLDVGHKPREELVEVCSKVFSSYEELEKFIIE